MPGGSLQKGAVSTFYEGVALPCVEAEIDIDTIEQSDDITLQEQDSDESNDEDVEVEASPEEDLSEEWTYDDQDIVEQIDETDLGNPIYEDIREKIESLSSNYDDKPDAVVDLVSFLESGDFLTLRDELRQIWSRLLKFHQQENTRIPHPALTAFTELDKHLKLL